MPRAAAPTEVSSPLLAAWLTAAVGRSAAGGRVASQQDRVAAGSRRSRIASQQEGRIAAGSRRSRIASQQGRVAAGRSRRSRVASQQGRVAAGSRRSRVASGLEPPNFWVQNLSFEFLKYSSYRYKW